MVSKVRKTNGRASQACGKIWVLSVSCLSFRSLPIIAWQDKLSGREESGSFLPFWRLIAVIVAFSSRWPRGRCIACVRSSCSIPLIYGRGHLTDISPNVTMTTISGAGREQPFECSVCHSRFTRHENLKRHSDLHTRPKGDASFACRPCRTTFSRRDLRDRHVKRKHPEQEEGRPAKVARRDTVTSTGQAHKERTSRPTTIRKPSAPPVAEQNDLLPQEWATIAYMDIGNGSWDMNMRYDPPIVDHSYTGLHTSTLDLGSDVAHNTGEPSIDAVNFTNPLLSQTPHPNPAPLVQDDTHSHMDILLHGTSQGQAHQHSASIGGGPGSSTPSPESSCDGVNPYSALPEGLSPKDLPYFRSEWYPSAAQVERGLDLYFSHVSHFIPFLHRPTLDVTCTPTYLTLSMLSLAYQYAEDPGIIDQPGSGEQLSILCFHRARVLVASEEEVEDDFSHNVALVQTLLLLEVCAIFYICGKTSTQGLKMHSRMISIARSAGLMCTALPEAATTKDLDSMWREAIKAESHKRTILAAHQIDALWYQILSIPRCLSHLEIKHDLPCPVECWYARTSADWAHRRLVASQTRQTQYTEAVRLFLSRSPDVNAIPPFDPFGAINITQFLLSSAREVSGWSTMTGQVSLERFEPLRESLVALASFICPREDVTTDSYAATRAATWEMAMIELNIWSPSHTGGIVESSVDGVLTHSTYLACSGELPFGSDILASIQPHLDWFLRHLDGSDDEASEAPWLNLYAYKAFLLAWQLVRGGVMGVMHAVGVDDNDADGAVSWMRKACSKKRQSRLMKMVVESLNVLDRRLG
jgi:hypothetical protein